MQKRHDPRQLGVQNRFSSSVKPHRHSAPTTVYRPGADRDFLAIALFFFDAGLRRGRVAGAVQRDRNRLNDA
jgi:hypothetical protein